eukprot:56339-Rhodomonas_salina.3
MPSPTDLLRLIEAEIRDQDKRGRDREDGDESAVLCCVGGLEAHSTETRQVIRGYCWRDHVEGGEVQLCA